MRELLKKNVIGLASLVLMSASVSAGWQVEWIDKFNGDGVNWNYWTAHIQANFNNEIQCYTDDESSAEKNYDVSDGTLKIIAHRKNVNCEGPMAHKIGRQAVGYER